MVEELLPCFNRVKVSQRKNTITSKGKVKVQTNHYKNDLIQVAYSLYRLAQLRIILRLLNCKYGWNNQICCRRSSLSLYNTIQLKLTLYIYKSESAKCISLEINSAEHNVENRRCFIKVQFHYKQEVDCLSISDVMLTTKVC